jgi:alpha-amylase/alpha-mannosidase (GH57 family)
MIYIAFAFNFNIQRCEVEVGDEGKIIRDGYQPLISTFLRHGLKADFFISGYSTEIIQQIEPGIIDTIKANLGKSFALGTYTYTHPIPQLLSTREFEQQISKGLSIDRKVYELNPEGFLPPEFAYNESMCHVLKQHGINWTVVLAKHLKQSAGQLPDSKLYRPHTATTNSGVEMTVVPASYQLPDTPARFFKLMMKGELSVEAVTQGVRAFANQYPHSLLLFKRDAETVFIDRLNSGFADTEKVLDRFIGELASMDDIVPINISEAIDRLPPEYKINLGDHLGNTKLETFTDGEARAIWDLTQQVRRKVENAEQRYPNTEAVRKAWEFLLLSHNSDGRIGYWFSEWNPGEHKVAPSRREFIENNLHLALESLEELPD